MGQLYTLEKISDVMITQTTFFRPFLFNIGLRIYSTYTMIPIEQILVLKTQGMIGKQGRQGRQGRQGTQGYRIRRRYMNIPSLDNPNS